MLPDFKKVTFKNCSPRFFAYYIKKYDDLYEKGKKMAELGQLGPVKLEILKKEGARRAMKRFMASVDRESHENEQQSETKPVLFTRIGNEEDA